MFGVHLRVRAFPIFGISTDQTNADRSLFNSLTCSSSSSFSLQLGSRERKSHGIKSILISCKASPGNSRRRSGHGDDERHDEYIEASILISETIRHYQLHKHGFVEETKLSPFYAQAKDSRTNVSSIGHGFLRRFQSPTIFRKIACEGDLLLPIIVGESAIEKLLGASKEDENGDRPSLFQFVKHLVQKLGYEVEMAWITERVANTYYARIFFRKPGEKAILSVDARPSDAINVAKRFKVPVYVNKQIVSTDAIRIVYGARRGSNSKTAYDVYLDSATEGPDLLSEELDMVRNLNIAVKEERYKDAGIYIRPPIYLKVRVEITSETVTGSNRRMVCRA
ncbi:Bifunctional nuclease domain [Macleaya cordata]|uniref:Bifunctional nuclease domain n=1 Tax=Macleaya cordata TaxID=56857 RepID=A0A200QEG8_MACCD|nr:Bifunctional nuclease domain [Macleaya cordata]